MKLVHRFAEAVGLKFYTSPQRYRVTYFFASEVNNGSTIFPILQDSPNQKIISLKFSHPTIRTIKEQKFGNSVGVYEGAGEMIGYEAEVLLNPSKGSTAGDGEWERTAGLVATAHVDPTDPSLDSWISQLGDLKGKTAGEKARTINRWIIEKLVYGDPIDGLYSSHETLTKPRVDCGGYDSLFCALCIRLGIPARIVSGFWVGYPAASMHAWAEFMDETGSWIPVDPSVEQLVRQGRSQKSGRFGFVGSDHLRFSTGCDVELSIDGSTVVVELLQHPTCVTDPSAKNQLTVTSTRL